MIALRPRRAELVAPCLILMLIGITLVGASLVDPQTAETGATESSAELARSLEALDIVSALRAYDTLTAASGPSAELLTRIARADLQYCLAEGKSWDRLEAARVLAEQGVEQGRQALQAQLEARHPSIRSSAATWLAEIEVAAAVPRLAAIAADVERTAHERIKAAAALHRLGEEAAAIPVIVEFSRSEDSRLRQMAAKALADLKDPAGLPALKALLADPVEAIALLAARGAAEFGDPAGRERLLEALSSPAANVRLLAAWYLGLAGSEAGVDVLKGMAEEVLTAYPDQTKLKYSPEFVIYALSWIDPEAGDPYISRVLGLEKWLSVRYVAARRLAEMGREEVLPALERIYSEGIDDPEMSPYRSNVVRFAGWVGDSPEARKLAERGLGSGEVLVELAALDVLARLGSPDALGPIRRFLGGSNLRHRALAAESLFHFGRGISPPESPAAPPPGYPKGG